LVKNGLPQVTQAIEKYKDAITVVQGAAMCLANMSTGDLSSDSEVCEGPGGGGGARMRGRSRAAW
jgi:hypothetical protein